MSLFKRSNKNKSASAASTPTQTPRASMQSSRSSDVKLTPEQAIYKITHNKLTYAAAGVDDIRIGDILYQAQSRRLRSLDTDIVDVGYFLHSEECVSLEILRCGNYEEVSLAKRLTKRLAKEVGAGSEELGLALGVATVETEAEFRRLPIPEDAFRNGMVRAINASNSTATNVDLSGESEDDDDDAYSSDGDSDGDKDTTALPPPFSRPNVSTPFRMTTALIARNLHLRILEFTNDCLEQDCDDVIPDMAPLIPRLVHLTKLKIQVILGLHEEFLASILCSLPESMQDVEIKAPKLLPPQRSIRRSRYPRIARKSSLCRLCLDPCGFEDFVGDDDQLVESNVMMFILKTIERSPRLVELELLGQHYKGMDVLRALSWHCPEIERLSLRVAFHHLETIMGIHGPPLLRLREVHIEGYIDAITMGLNAHEEQYRRVLPDFLRRSYKTLEVLTVEAEYSGRIACDVAFETEAWNFWRGCPRLRSSPCINLRTLRCVDFGYVKLCAYNDYYDYMLDESGDHDLAGRSVDPNTNALNLIQLNPKLTALEVMYEQQHYRANHFIPAVLLSISRLQSLSLIKIELEVVLPESFLLAVLRHLPQSLVDFTFSVKGLHKLPEASTAVQLASQEYPNLRQITLNPCTYWAENEDDEASAEVPFNSSH
ncbi:hypothetical protein BG015_003499 [Linnemannia schmuckeri]|uniref:Uncharacterized protein n=1 Tax=Linnemannia schmuckeri TaxID=64567 RepID=A0A9P5V438_9FUNG|nr:hypothetical protein BG015_003499 [Linnemannia schmuckeri]